MMHAMLRIGAGLLRRGVLVLVALGAATAAQAQEQPEYRLKAAFLFNFALFTEWPGDIGPNLQLCLFGNDPFGAEVDTLAGKRVGERALVLSRRASVDALKSCHILYVAPSAVPSLPRLSEALRGLPVLIVADTPGAAQSGAALNMALAQGRVSFEANLKAARDARLQLNAKLLRLATEVLQ